MKRMLWNLFFVALTVCSCENVIDDHSSNPAASADRDYYRSMVDRDAIEYQILPENDPSYEVNQLRIIQINDTHGAYHDDETTIGFSRVAAAIDELTLSYYSTIKIANGDLMQGSAFSNLLLGEPAIASLNECGFDAFVIGNHEFDWGLDALRIYKDQNPENGELNCPFLGANILDKNNQRPDWIEPYTIVEKGNLKVGIIGVIGDGQESSIAATALGGYHFADTTETINQYCKILEPQTDVIIVASHAHDEAINASYVNTTNRIDAIINGHDHRCIEETVTRNLDHLVVPVIESDDKNDSIGVIDLQIENKRYTGTYAMEHVYPQSYEIEERMQSIIDIYHTVMESYLTLKLKDYTSYLSRQELGCLAAEVMVEKFEVDFAFTNRAGIRADIAAGPLTISSIYEVFPFDNCVATTEMSGSEILTYFNRYMNSYYYSRNNLVGGSGSRMDLSLIEPSKVYTIATFDFVATNYMADYFTEDRAIFTDTILRDLMIEYFQFQ